MVGKFGAGGVSIHKCGTCVVIGTYNPDMKAGMNSSEVGKMADYLKQHGY